MIAFAHRGRGSGHADNTLAGFNAARLAGIRGVETDAWLSKDGIAVLDHDGVVHDGASHAIAGIVRADLPGHIPSMAELYAACGTDLEVAVDVKDPGAAAALIDAARTAGGDATRRLWLCHPTPARAAAWAETLPEGHRVWSPELLDRPLATIWPALRDDVSAMVRSGQITVVNLHPRECTDAMAAECLSLGALLMVWGVNDAAELERVRRLGTAAIHSDSHELCLAAQRGEPPL